jgi:hypothetical protein
MFSKKSRNKIKTFAGMLMCALAVLAAPCASLTSFAAENTGVEARTDVREWMWKVEDGKLYKCLYNASTGLWETDWIYVCDYDGEL